MRRLLIPALLLLLAVTPLAAADLDRVRAADIQGRCSDGKPRAVLVVDGDAADDCANGGSTTEVLCCCLDGDWAACSSGTGGSGDITDVWGCTSGNCNAITGASGDSLDAGSADSSRPGTRSTSLPSDCYEGQVHQDTDSGGSETYICTVGDGPGGSADTWTKLSSTAAEVTDNVSPYGQYDPDNPPASCAVCDEFTDDTATLTWTWANQGTASYSLANDKLKIVGAGENTLILRGLWTDAPSGSFTLSVKLSGTNTANNYAGTNVCALYAGDTTTPTGIRCCEMIHRGTTTWAALSIQEDTWTSYTTLGAGGTVMGNISVQHSEDVYLQLRYDTTADTIVCAFANDGDKWIPLSAGLAGVTSDPTKIGIFTQSYDSALGSFSADYSFFRARTDANRNLAGE